MLAGAFMQRARGKLVEQEIDLKHMEDWKSSYTENSRCSPGSASGTSRYGYCE